MGQAELEKGRVRGETLEFIDVWTGWILKAKMARGTGRFVLGYERAEPRRSPEPFYLSKGHWPM